MPTGVHISDEKMELIVRLLSSGVTPSQVAAQVGLHYKTISNVRLKLRREESDNSRGQTNNP